MIKLGEKVWHKKNVFLGEGIVKEISKSGRSAYVIPQHAYYRLIHLEVM